MKRILKDYFSFSKKERHAFLLLFSLLVLFAAAPYFYPVKKTVPAISEALAALATQNSGQPYPEKNYPATDLPGKPARVEKPFVFDPNTIDESGWKRLGLPDKTIRTILHYRDRGGRFRKPEDIGKIWGMPEADKERLIPYVRIPGEHGNPPWQRFRSEKSEKKLTDTARININTASVAEWEILPGIGPVLANRVVRYRDKIGGFGSVEQVAKTYGITDSLFQQIRSRLFLESATPPKLRLNTASVFELTNKLKLPETIARAILVYRKEYGPFASIADLKKLVILPDSVYQRIAPLLVTD